VLLEPYHRRQVCHYDVHFFYVFILSLKAFLSYGATKVGVHHLAKSIADKQSGFPETAKVIVILPYRLTTSTHLIPTLLSILVGQLWIRHPIELLCHTVISPIGHKQAN
jgi:hypothetical protein